jgi:hypothetical protein
MHTINTLRAIALVFLLLLAPLTSATPQTPDSIILDGLRVPLLVDPLSIYLAVHPDTLPQSLSELYVSSNSRGYVSTWKISKNRLVLRKIEVLHAASPSTEEDPSFYWQNVVGEIFQGTNPVVANWYSGALVIPRGKLLQRDRMHTNSIYERYAVVSIRNGQVIRRVDFDKDEFEAFKTFRFNAFKQTAKFVADLEKFKRANPESTPENAEMVLAFYAREHYLSADFLPGQ